MTTTTHPIPDDIRETLDLYVSDGLEPGGFLVSVLENDLRGAALRADPPTVPLVADIARYVAETLPRDCHGSREAVEAWVRGKS